MAGGVFGNDNNGAAMQIYRSKIDEFIVPCEHSYDEVVAKLAHTKMGILFVVGPDFQFKGTITRGDINALNAESVSMSALDICNKSSLVADVSDLDNKISRLMTQKIRCVPLLNDKWHLVEIAWLLESGKKVNLNVGSGGVSIPGFVNLDVESDWYKKQHQESVFVKFDIRVDELPYGQMSVHNIYCSHVIEHIEDKFVNRFLENCHRVLATNGVVRIACPDAEFLYKVSSFDNDYWFWRREWFKTHLPQRPLNEVTQEDFLIREIATSKVSRDSTEPVKFSEQSIAHELRKLTHGLTFDLENIGNHINFWTFEKLGQLAKEIGFKHVIESKYQGCISQDMVGEHFDKTRPGMSLYVDLVK